MLRVLEVCVRVLEVCVKTGGADGRDLEDREGHPCSDEHLVARSTMTEPRIRTVWTGIALCVGVAMPDGALWRSSIGREGA